MKTTIKSFEINNTIKAIDTDDTLYITGIANTGNEDLIGDVVTVEALNQIAEQIPQHNLHLDHGKEIKDILGPLIEGEVTEKGLEYKARILNEKKDFIKSLLEQGVNLGSSISGTYEYEVDSKTNINQWNLTEISLTGIPCDQGTMATVQQSKSFDNIINELKKNNGDDTMADNTQQATNITKEDVIQIVNDALNEQKEEMAQSIKEDIAEEFVTNEQLKEVLDNIKKDDKPSDEPSDNQDNKSDDEPTTDDTDDKDDSNNNDDVKEPKDDDDAKKHIDSMIQKQVDEKINAIFKSLNNTTTGKYHAKPSNKNVNKSTFTPEELAKML